MSKKNYELRIGTLTFIVIEVCESEEKRGSVSENW